MRTLTVSSLLASALMWLWAGVSHAQPVTGSGTFTVPSAVVVSSRQAGENIIVETHVVTQLEGILQGTMMSDETAVVHPNGVITVSAFETFTGTVDGIAGTAAFRTVGTLGPDGKLTGHFTIMDAAGDLSGLHGQGTIVSEGEVGSYEVSLELPARS